MHPRPPFDPRTELRAVLHDLGPAPGGRPGASGAPARHQRMSVFLDGVERIDQGLVIAGGDPLVAMRSCPCCELFECELVEGYAASVRRFGPYVLWLTSWCEHHAFTLERYQEAFGGDVGLLEPPGPRDDLTFEDVTPTGTYRCPDGRLLAFDVARAPEEPLARLAAWRGGPHPGLEAVLPPERAVELPSVVAGAPSLWVDEAPRADGRRAAYLPGVFPLPVWLAGPDVEAVVAAALGPAGRPPA